MARAHLGERRGRGQAAVLIVLLAVLAGVFVWKFSIVADVDLSAYSQPIRQAVQDLGLSAEEDSESGDPVSGGGYDGGLAKEGLHIADRLQRRPRPPIAKPDPSVVEERCGCALGDWCGRYEAQTPIPAKAPPLGDRQCLWGNDTTAQCNWVGVCDGMMGWCRCPAGWNGDDCSRRMRRPCSQAWRTAGFEPYQEPTDPGKWGLTLACTDYCDQDIAHCYCNETFAYGRIPADPGDRPGTPPKRPGRPIAHYCRRNTGWDGKKSDFGAVNPELLYGDKGWCVAEEPEYRCPCILDGVGGSKCEIQHEAFCPNQCNGHGECQLGFCKCHEGWWGHDCAYRTAGTPWTPGMEEGERPWLKPFVHTPAAREPAEGATRRRPLIYVYELPPMYNALMLQYRVAKDDCTHRVFNEQNESYTPFLWLYQPETGIHEMLLQSEHRTLDPEEADYFYLPVYASCAIWPVLYSNDFPYFHGGPAAQRTHGATNMFMEVQSWVRSHFPYWDRNGGRDHIVLTVHDEGSCWLPAVLRPAIVMSHWGRTDVNPPAGTGYDADTYSNEVRHPVWQPEGHLSKLGEFPCYDPSKDLVLPYMSNPEKYKHSPLMGASAQNRTILAFFKGRIQPENARYSRGTRQFLANISEAEGWWDKYRIHVGAGSPPGGPGDYSECMARSVFCLALMGDGYSSRFDDAVLHGCIPVIVQDGIELTWHSLLDIPAYSLRVPQADMARIPQILQAVPQEDIARMQANLAKVWRRHIWTGYRPYGEQVKAMLAERRQSAEQYAVLSQPAPLADYDPAEDDALATLMQWLYSRLDDLGAHAPPPKPGAAPKKAAKAKAAGSEEDEAAAEAEQFRLKEEGAEQGAEGGKEEGGAEEA